MNHQKRKLLKSIKTLAKKLKPNFVYSKSEFKVYFNFAESEHYPNGIAIYETTKGIKVNPFRDFPTYILFTNEEGNASVEYSVSIPSNYMNPPDEELHYFDSDSTDHIEGFVQFILFMEGQLLRNLVEDVYYEY